jgi:hypothetical protein
MTLEETEKKMKNIAMTGEKNRLQIKIILVDTTNIFSDQFLKPHPIPLNFSG